MLFRSVWYRKDNNEVLWSPIPKWHFDEKKYGFRVSTVKENKENIHEIYRLIRERKPHAPIVFTLSPVPLMATFRPQSCVTSNAVSKAVLRSSLDEVIREIGRDDRLFYWPSYEIITEAFDDPWREDKRHVQEKYLDVVMNLFESIYCLN